MRMCRRNNFSGLCHRGHGHRRHQEVFERQERPRCQSEPIQPSRCSFVERQTSPNRDHGEGPSHDCGTMTMRQHCGHHQPPQRQAGCMHRQPTENQVGCMHRFREHHACRSPHGLREHHHHHHHKLRGYHHQRIGRKHHCPYHHN